MISVKYTAIRILGYEKKKKKKTLVYIAVL